MKAFAVRAPRSSKLSSVSEFSEERSAPPDAKRPVSGKSNISYLFKFSFRKNYFGVEKNPMRDILLEKSFDLLNQPYGNREIT